MPERRKMKSPSPKMTSTPKVKRRTETEETEKEIQQRLGFSESPNSRKEFSQPGDSAELSTEYNDGTTRPMFKKRLKSTTAKTGERAQLECQVSGNPLPKILWLKNNRPLKASDGCKVVVDEGTNTLVFPQARDEDAGIYTARAMNVNGSIMCSAEFSLSDGEGQAAVLSTDSPLDLDFTTPAYFFQMSSCEVSEGRLARFDCRVVAYPRPEIVWMRDGKVIDVDVRFKLLNFNNEIYSLLIQDVRIEDTGRYTCWARNKFGEAMTEAYLNVKVLSDEEDEGDIAPKFLTRFYDQQTTEGTQSGFKCLIAGRPEPSVTWLLDDIEIHDTPGIRMRHVDGTVSLEIRSPKVDHSGSYTCQLSNKAGQAVCSAKLTVIEDKLHGRMLPKFIKKFDHIAGKEGEDIKFSAVIVGEPRPDVMWLYDHKPISDANRRFVAKEDGDAFTLLIKNLRFDDAGKITCKAVNSEGEVYCSANLTVRDSKFLRDQDLIGMKDETDAKFGYCPTFTKRLQDMSVTEGSKATFDCRVMGIPDPEISWMKDGRVITPGGRIRMTYENGYGQLVIDNVSSADTGVYTCIISNAQGKSSSTAALKLEDTTKKDKYKPEKLEDRLSRKDRYSPDKYLLDDTPAVKPKRTYMDESKGAKPKRPYVDMDKKYEDDKSRPIDIPEVRAPPRLPTHRPIITDLGEETVRLAWKPVEPLLAKRVPPVSYRLEAKELPGKDWVPMTDRLRDTSHYLSQLGTDRDYMIRVRAENDYGISEPTEPLWLPRARTFPGVPITRPKIVDYEETRAKLNWSRVDIPTFSLDDSPLLYMLEVEEPPFKDWRTIARDLDDTEYLVEGLRPGQDYRFRIRAKTATGVLSEPSPAVSLYSTLAQGRSPVDRLQMLDYEPDTRSLQLTWDRVHIPPYNMDEEPLMYMIEYNEPPMPDWKPLVTGIPTTRYRVMHLDPQRDYNFRVRALTSYGVSPPSPALPVSLRQPAAARGLPEAVVISDVDSDSLRLTWKRPMYDLDRPISYKIEMLEPPFSNWRPIATNVLDTTYRVTGLKPTKDYQFRVIPQMGSSYLEPTPSAALTMLPVRPRLPMTEPKLKELTPESIQLSWRPAEVPAYQRKHQPIYYKVEMLELPSSSWVPVARKLTSPSYNMTGLRPDLEYKFRVFAETDGGFSEPSLPAVLHRRPVPKFSSNMPTIKDISQNVVHLTWKPADIYDGASPISYMVEMQTPPGIGTWRTLYANHPMPSVRLADLRPDLDYMVRVRVQCGSYLSEPTLPLYIPRRAAPPRMSQEQPYAVDIGSDYVKLQWRSAEIPSHIMDYAPITYRLEAQEYPDTTWITIQQGIPHTDFKVTGLNSQRDYSFRVRAENEFGLSDPTQPMNLPRRSVAPILPQDEPMLYDVTSGSCRLAWRPASLPSYTPHTSPITYTLFVQEYPFKVWRPLVKRIPHTSYFLTGLQPDKEYMFRIQAENDCGTSKPTSAVRLPKYSDIRRPVSMPEVSDFDEDLTSVKLRWQPRASPLTDRKPGKYTLETWEPVRRVWKPVARGVRDTTYQVRDLPKIPDHLFRVRVETEPDVLSEPSLPVSISKYSLPKMPVFKPQLYEVDNDTVRLSWQPVHVPEGTSRRLVKYIIEQRELPETHWFPVANDVTDTSYKIRGLRLKSDYEFRVKAVIDGTTTAPSYPVTLFRRPVIPKVKFEAPEVYDVDDTSLSLKWNTVDVPAFARDDEPLLFVIERQTLPGYEWTPVATNITDRTYKITDLKPYEDYNFRIRGVYPSGYTEPSPYVPVYRRPIRSSVPIARTEVWEEAPHTARLRWHRAYIPRYYSSTPIKYRVEMQEGYGGMTDSDWRPVARDVTRPDITVGDISPKKDYRFRIRAELENGDVSEPTPPIQYYRSHLPVHREPLTDYKLVEYEAVFLNRPYFDHLTKYVPPRMPIEKPEMSIIDQESVELMWKPAIVAEAIKGMCNLSYTIEVRCPPSFEWRELVTGIRICSYTVTKLHPRIDYVFRVRAWNEYGTSETTLPVSLYRPQALKSEEDDDAEFEREWELKYGAQDADPNACMTKVPPKLPMDTPRIVTQTPESIWFNWLTARIPAYATQTNINYVVEVKEPPSTAWRREATNIVDCQYVLEGLNPNQEYHIRVRAETEFGPSEPTMPIIIRGKGSRPGSRRSSVDRDDINLEGKLDVSYLENLMSGVPPRMPSTRPIATNAEPDKLTLKWSSCRTPSYVRASNVTYVVEKRELPSHIWSVVAKDIKGTKYEVTGLNGDQDYMFRVRAKNEYGVSDPTLPMTIYRDRDDYVPPRVRSRSSSRDSLFGSRSAPRGRSTSVDYSGSRFEDIERSSVDRLPCEPELTATTNYDVQYGMIGNKGKITLKIKAYPLPTVHWYFNDTKIEYGDLYNSFVTPTGDVVLEMKRVGPDSAGFYKCFAENASGSASKTVTFELAEPPTVLEPLQDVIVTDHEPVKFMCRVDGFPNATIKWTKDWRPIAGSTHCKISNPSSEVYQIEIPNCVDTDAGLYACTIENLAGKVVLTARLTVEIDTLPATFDSVNIRSTPIEDRYHVLEEIGRGRFGIVRRIIEMSTGRTFAANYMSFRNKSQKHFFMSEFQTLCSLSQTDGILKLYDAFETDRSLIFVTEYLSEPDLLEKVIKDGNWTESNVAGFIKKLLTLLLELEKLNILHLDIKPGNIRMTGSGLSDPKLIGFGYSRTLVPEEEITQNYGSIGYASPEQVTNDVVTQASDLWSVGVLAYLLLSGTSPFQSGSEVEVLSLTSECLWTFEGRGFDNFSKEGKDFIGRLLVRDPKQRMTLSECLDHPWLSMESNTKINTDRLKQFYNAEQIQRNLEKVYTTVQLQSFAKIIHGRKALYQPAVDIESGEIIFPDSDEFGNYLDEDAWYQWQLQYLDDPDSQIYPIQDEGFTVRECRHAGAPKFSKPKIKERSDRDDVDSGTGILFRDKIQPTTFKPGDEASFTCTVICEKKNVTPIITWYRDESLLSDDYRSEAEFNPDTGVAKLTIVNTKDYDSAVYKCVARIKDGRVSCQARLYLGDIPSKPGRPLVMQTSGTEAFLTWNCPDSDGNAYILGYRVDYRKNKYTTWNIGPYVTEEYALISGLSPDTDYIFRVCCSNKYGTSPFSWSSLPCKTFGADAPKVSVAADLLPVMQFSTFDKQQTVLPPESRRSSLTVPEEATMAESDPNETFTFSDIISKGSYGEYRSCINKSTNQQCVAKIMPYNADNEATVRAEFDLLHTLRQNNLITVLDSYIHGDKMYVIHEYLSGMNVIEYLCLHKTYSEEKVAFLVRQILDAVSFIKHYGIVHLNLQPSSIAMASTRRPHIKLRDFTLAQKIDRDVGMTGAPAGYPDFTCPEVLKEEKVSFTADIWTIGALTFTMLSGVSPFCGKTIEETLSRILFDRYSTKEMYDNVSKESIKFVCKLMSRLPRNRPTVNKCLDSHWMNLNESMVNSRSTKHFKSDRLRIFLKYYMGQRGNEDYKVAKVDIATLPKIVPAPQTEPILSDKIINKLEIETPNVSLADVLHAEAAKIPELPLLEKLLYKIELEKAAEEPEVRIDAEQGDTAVEAEAEKVEVDEGLVADAFKKTESGLKPEAATVGDDNEKSKSVDRSRSISVDRSKIAKAKKVIKVKGSEVDVSINEELSVKKVEKEVAAEEHIVETVDAEKAQELAKNNITEEKANETVTDQTKEPIKQHEVSEVIENVEGKRLETEKLADVSRVESGEASTDILDKKETTVEATAVAQKPKKVEEVQQTSVAEDKQPGSDAPEGKVEVHEADEEFVDALESITPDVKSEDKTLEPESKEDVVDDGAEDEFSEAPETNGHDEHPKIVEENNEQKTAPSELSNESMQTIDNLAETKAEEIKTAALKEIAEGISQNKQEPSKLSEVADESSTSNKEADVSLNDDKSPDTAADAAGESVKSAVAAGDNAETEDSSKPMPVDSIDEKANITKTTKADNEKSDQPSEEVIENVSKETFDVDSAKKSVDLPKPEEATTSKDDADSKVVTSPEQELTQTAENVVEKAMEEAVSAVAAVATSEASSTDIEIKEENKSHNESGQKKNKDETDKVETDSNAAGEVIDTSQTEASDKLKPDELKVDAVSPSDAKESDSVMKADNEASKSEETCKDSSAKDESESSEQSVVEKEEAVENVKTEESKDSTDGAATSSDVSAAVGDNDRDVAADSKSATKNDSETAEDTTKQTEEIGTSKEEVASVISSTSESAKQTEASEKEIAKSDAKEESGASDIADAKADSANASIKSEDVSVLESVSGEEAKTSESIAEGDSIVSETLKESESKETCESKEAASLSTEDTVTESNATAQSILESSENIVSESVTEYKESVSECSMKEETVVTESISKTETVVSESESSISETLVSENDSKSNETVDDDKTENVDSANVEAKETVLSGSISQSELIESETVSKEESSISEISKKQTEASETSDSNVDKSDNKSKSKEISESSEIVSEKDKDKLLNEQTDESLEVKNCEIKELNTEDSSETVSIVETDKQITAEQAVVENVSKSELTTDTVESTLSEHVVATKQSSSEHVESALEKTTTVVETVEQSFVDGKLEVTERKETNVVITEKMSPEETVIVESSSTKSETSASVNDEVDSANAKAIVTEGQESATVEVQSSQESTSVGTVTSEEVSESVSKLVKNESEVTEVVSMERKETLISGSTVTESSEEITTVSSSVVEETVSEMAEASNLEIAKPDEEKIAKETSVNQYLDDALMFC